MVRRFIHLLEIINVLILIIVVFLTALPQLKSEAADAGAIRTLPCSVATIVGDWGFRTTAKAPDGSDVIGVGTFSVARDGRSRFQGWSFANRPGATLTEISGSGTTTVNPDCTGMQVWEAIPDDPARTVIGANGNEIWAAYTKRLNTVTLKRIGRVPGQASTACSTAMIAGDWGFRTSAKAPDGSDVIGVGTFSVARDGRSRFRGWNFANRPGAMLTETSGSGTTTVNADCTGMQVWEAIPDDPARFVIVGNADELWAVYTKRFSGVTLNKIGEPLAQATLAASHASFPKGTYTTELARGDIPGSFPPQFAPGLVGKWQTTFAEDGTHTVAKDGQLVLTGRYAATRNEIVFFGDKGPLGCDIQERDPRPFFPPGSPARARSGVYTWTFDGRLLTLTKVADDCPGRVVFFTAHPLAKQK